VINIDNKNEDAHYMKMKVIIVPRYIYPRYCK